jgi:hypothetical protein
MNPSEAICNLYRLTGDEFDRRFAIMRINLQCRLLEAIASFPMNDIDDAINSGTKPLIDAQVQGARHARLTEEQRLDFESRIDNLAADVVQTVRQVVDSGTPFTDRSSFQSGAV